MTEQLGLFAEASGASPPSEAVAPFVAEEDRALAARLPAWLRLGTSSWSFPGWAKLVYAEKHTEQVLARAGLEAFAQHPLLRTVSLDRSHYAPLRDDDLAGYARQLEVARSRAPTLAPFRMVSKVWDELTTAVFPTHPRYGARGGERNAAFLDADRCLGEVLEPYRRSPTFAAHAGPFVLELTPMPEGAWDERALVLRAERFLQRMPNDFAWAFEIRNRELYGQRWLDMLRAHGAAHVFTFWTAMPSIREQLAKHGPLATRFVVARLMLPPFSRYEAKKAEYAPFDRLALVQEDMRDDVVRLVLAAAEHGCDDAYVLVNNKAEGSAPLTARGLAQRVVRAMNL